MCWQPISDSVMVTDRWQGPSGPRHCGCMVDHGRFGSVMSLHICVCVCLFHRKTVKTFRSLGGRVIRGGRCASPNSFRGGSVNASEKISH